MAGSSVIPVPEQPGRVYNTATGTVTQMDQVYEGEFYDTVEFLALTANLKKDIFKSQDGVSGSKSLQFTNMTQTKRIPSYAKLKLQRLGVHVRQWAGTARPNVEDVVALYEMSSLRFLLGSTNLIAEGPLLVYQSGLGLTGVSTANNFSVLSNGVAAQSAAPRLREEADINDKVDMNCVVTIGDNLLLTTSTQPIIAGTVILCTVVAHGIVTRPLGS